MNYSKSRPLDIENLIGDSCQWYVIYLRGNWSLNHIMMVLPNLDPDIDSDESLINHSCINVPNGCFEEARAVNQWLEKHGELPFIISGSSFNNCCTQLHEKLADYHDDWDKFLKDAKLFDQWRRVVHYVYTGGESLMYELWEHGWESLIEKSLSEEV